MAKLPPVNAINIVLKLSPHEAKYVDEANVRNGFSINILRMIMDMNMDGERRRMVDTADLSGGSNFWILNWTSVHRSPLHTLFCVRWVIDLGLDAYLDPRQSIKPKTSKSTSPQTVNNSPTDIIPITNTNLKTPLASKQKHKNTKKLTPMVICSILKINAKKSTKIGALALIIV